MRRLVTSAALILATAAGLSACGKSDDAGSADPPAQDPSTPSAAPSSAPSASNDPFAGLDPCKVLAAGTSAEGFKPGKEDKSIGKNCQANPKDASDKTSVGLNFVPDAPYQNFTLSPKVKGDLNGRPAYLYAAPDSLVCEVDMQVTKSTSLVFGRRSKNSPDKGCKATQRMAERIDKQLKQQGK